MSEFYGWASVYLFIGSGLVRMVQLGIERWKPSLFFERKAFIYSVAMFLTGVVMVAVALYDAR